MSYRNACAIARESPNTQIIILFDREGDIAEIFAEAEARTKEGCHANFIVRSNHDRIIENEDADTKLRLKKKLRNAHSLGEIEFVIPTRGTRKGRCVKQQVKAVSVVLAPRGKKKAMANAVMCEEINPPDGEEPVVWSFITDLPVRSFEEAAQVAKYYLCRWGEITLKCQPETYLTRRNGSLFAKSHTRISRCPKSPLPWGSLSLWSQRWGDT